MSLRTRDKENDAYLPPVRRCPEIGELCEKLKLETRIKAKRTYARLDGIVDVFKKEFLVWRAFDGIAKQMT
jgi:hypothetical protein